jgi:hypothetical protein
LRIGFGQLAETVGDGQGRVQGHLPAPDVLGDVDRRHGTERFSGKLGQPARFGLEHFGRHVPDLFQGERRRSQRVEGHGLHDELRIPLEMGLDREALDKYVGHVEGGALGRQGAHGDRMQASPIDVDGDFDAAALGQVVDELVVADIAVQPEDAAGFAGFEDTGTVFGAPRAEFGGFDRKRVGFGELFRQHGAVAIIGAGLAAEGGFIAIEVQRLAVLPEIRQIFG